MKFIIKLFPEITIKSKPVRQRFIRQLRDNVRKLLNVIDSDIRVERTWDRLEVLCDSECSVLQQQIVERLQNTPGISNFVLVKSFPWQGMDAAVEHIKPLFAEQLESKTFAVRCKRIGNHDFKSADVERYIGGKLFVACRPRKVDLTNPEVMVRLELRHDELSVVLQRYEGLGGFPLGTQDGVLSLMSGGFDSTVSSYLTMKRGLLTHFCFFNLGGRAHEVGVKEIAVYLWLKFGASHRVKFVTVPFEEVVREILENVDNSYMGVVLKRMMLRAATEIADQWQWQALVTGESVAQVSSQTLTNLAVIDSVTEKLVLRPLATMDKEDIIQLSRKIGTEEFSAVMPEYCGVISVNPTTRAKREMTESVEQKFDFSVLKDAVESSRAVNIDEIVTDIKQGADVAVVDTVPEGATIIDVRHPEEEELDPLQLDSSKVIKIPFYRLHNDFRHLDQAKYWLLYCEKGVMSQLHAQYLKDEGYDNVQVYRP